MYGEIDLELFTLAIIQLNTAFQKLNEGNCNVEEYFDSSYDKLKKLYESLDEIISCEEINATEVEAFFTYSINSFPIYKNQLENYENIPSNLNESRHNLIEIFDKLNQIANDYFKNMEVIE